MGAAPTANLAYGYDLGCFGSWNTVEPIPYDNEDDDEFLAKLTACLYKAIPAAGRTGDADEAVAAHFGVEFDTSNLGDSPGFILLASGSLTTAWNADAETLNFDVLRTAQAAGQWDTKLAAALSVLDLTPTAPSARWLLYPYYIGL